MAVTTYRIVSADESSIHDEPHLERSRVTVRQLHAVVEKAGQRPDRVADRHGLDVGEVYEALAYYHRNPEEMQRVEARHTRAATEAARQSSVTPEE
ncbi:DUF433 domain-containing protein [Halorubrum sp. CBA1229]|uniref:DUF433 domain-containing protein n=1 Tax=Halorubrum sp. CBA1229 TaxID=1853699 RepID=UPI000F3B659D|nr:DUF433 domain-containing protein [Halorubrum sp. CBA1229]QKY15600.1 DUF433 domain-containing protein [Halorubrum sp. CBA1229]